MITYNELKNVIEVDQVVDEIINGQLVGVYENGLYKHDPKKLIGYIYEGNKIMNQKGFTLIEIIAVLLIIGVLAAIAVPRFMGGVGSAANSAALASVDELNTREKLLWSSVKLQPYSEEEIDSRIFRQLDLSGIPWIDFPSESGGEIRIESRGFKLKRIGATESEPARWKK